MPEKNQSKSHLALVFIISQLVIITLLWTVNTRPDIHFPDFALLLFLIICFIVNLLYLEFFFSIIRSRYLTEYMRNTEENCQTLLASYHKLGSKQKDLQKETHDIINAQFTYHNYLSEGNKEAAEDFRRTIQQKWENEG